MYVDNFIGKNKQRTPPKKTTTPKPKHQQTNNQTVLHTAAVNVIELHMA